MAEVRINAGAFLASVLDAAAHGVTAAAFPLQREIGRVLNRAKSPPSSAPGDAPHKMTGALARSWEVQRADTRTLTSRVYSTLPYARFLERGAVIRPKNGKAIVIPMSAEARKAIAAHGGRARNAILALKALGLISPRKTANGKLWVKETKGRGKARIGARSEAMFLVTKSATIAPRPYIARSIAAAQADMQRAFSDGFRKNFNRTAAGGVK